MAVAILTDSTADFTLDELEELSIFMIPLTVTVAGKSYVDALEITAQQFYELLEQSDTLPTSSQPAPGAFTQKYQEIKDAGFDEVIGIFLNSEFSGTYNTAKTIGESIEGLDVYCVDSRSGCGQTQLLVERACAMRDAGMSAKEIYEDSQASVPRARIFFSPSTYENLVKGGRASKLTAAAANILDIRITVNVDELGKIRVADKARGVRRITNAMVKQFSKFANEFSKFGAPWVKFVHNGDLVNLEILREQINKLGIDYVDKGISLRGATITTHVGTNAFGFAISTPPPLKK